MFLEIRDRIPSTLGWSRPTPAASPLFRICPARSAINFLRSIPAALLPCATSPKIRPTLRPRSPMAEPDHCAQPGFHRASLTINLTLANSAGPGSSRRLPERHQQRGCGFGLASVDPGTSGALLISGIPPAPAALTIAGVSPSDNRGGGLMVNSALTPAKHHRESRPHPKLRSASGLKPRPIARPGGSGVPT